MTENIPPLDHARTDEQANWQQPSLQALAALSLETMPSFEVLLLDDIAGYVMGAGPLPAPYTVEHASRVVSAVFAALVNSTQYEPLASPSVTTGTELAREQVVGGAHALAALGQSGLNRLTTRLIQAVLGELERHRDAPEQQTCSLFYFALLAIASGPSNLLSTNAADGVAEIFQAWDEVFGRGFMVPWREAVTN